MDLLAEKKFPDEYPAEAVTVLHAMTIPRSELLVLGSAALRSQRYAGDYDAHDKVVGKLPRIIEEFQSMIERLTTMPDVHIMDIKAGEIEEWRAVPSDERAFRRDATERKIEQLLEAGIIEKKDVADYDLSNYLMASHSVKPHTVRWTPDEVLAGEKTLKDGRTYTLKEAFRAPAIVKVDVIAPVRGVYRDFSVIYDLYDGTRRLNGYTEDVAKSIKQDISYYTQIGNPYKALKRKFALAKLQNDEPALKRYSKIINSKLGKMYLIYSELKTLADLLESGAPVTGLQKLLQSIAPEGMAEDLKQVRTAADYPRLRHIEQQLLAQLSRGTRLSGGRYEPYKAGSV